MNMKRRLLIRPVVYVELSTFKQRLIAYYVWLKFVVLKSRVTMVFKLNEHISSERKCLVIPKYKFIKQ